jgi:hypothetical protein
LIKLVGGIGVAAPVAGDTDGGRGHLKPPSVKFPRSIIKGSRASRRQFTPYCVRSLVKVLRSKTRCPAEA